MREGPGRHGPLAAGERVLLVDPKGRRYLLKLVTGAQFHTHAGIIDHDGVIGADAGATITGSTGRRFLVVRPTLADVVLKMPRGAQVIYPKDLGAILVAADIGPGLRVLEAGVGSGALSMTMLRAGAEVVGYERRGDFATKAVENVTAFLGEGVAYRVEERDIYEGIEARERGPCFDRVVLDLPEPWRVLPHAPGALVPGGIVLAYLPSVTQVAEFRAALERGPFGMAETFELMRRTWHVEDRAVRPDHRMVGHTGFLTTARLLLPVPGDEDGPGAPGDGGDQGDGDRTGPGQLGPCGATASPVASVRHQRDEGGTP
ncbi:MAG TPA: tRNA (adenine-N1)-methyltransferase [Acidimicrobiales bacterium]|nr:tRNA (adenine-N1)-methyltransferase [Acidimicrobiales bacterium]